MLVFYVCIREDCMGMDGEEKQADRYGDDAKTTARMPYQIIIVSYVRLIKFMSGRSWNL